MDLRNLQDANWFARNQSARPDDRSTTDSDAEL
jgi:hypothetical protein